MPVAQRVEGIVLKSESHGESNRVLWILSKDLGVIQVLARGASKSKKRFSGRLETFTSGEFWCLASKRGRPTLTSVDVVVDRFSLSRSIDAYFVAVCIADWVLRWQISSDDARTMFHVVSVALDGLLRGMSPLVCLSWLELNLLKIAGSFPSTESCALCDEGLQGRPCAVCPLSGCFVHSHHGGPVIPMFEECRRILAYLETVDSAGLCRLRLFDGQALRILGVLETLFLVHVGFVPRSRSLALARFAGR